MVYTRCSLANLILTKPGSTPDENEVSITPLGQKGQKVMDYLMEMSKKIQL